MVYIVSYDGNQPDKMCPDLTEEQLENINRARWEERIITEGPKLYFSWDNLSLHITNMPTDDEQKIGVLRDSLAMLVNVSDRRLALIKKQATWNSGITLMHTLLDESMDKINDDLSAWRDKVMVIFNEMAFDFEEAVKLIGLSAEQVNLLFDQMVESINSARNHSTESLTVGDTLKEMMVCIEGLDHAGYQEVEHAFDDHIDDSASSVELF